MPQMPAEPTPEELLDHYLRAPAEELKELRQQLVALPVSHHAAILEHLDRYIYDQVSQTRNCDYQGVLRLADLRYDFDQDRAVWLELRAWAFKGLAFDTQSPSDFATLIETLEQIMALDPEDDQNDALAEALLSGAHRLDDPIAANAWRERALALYRAHGSDSDMVYSLVRQRFLHQSSHPEWAERMLDAYTRLRAQLPPRRIAFWLAELRRLLASLTSAGQEQARAWVREQVVFLIRALDRSPERNSEVAALGINWLEAAGWLPEPEATHAAQQAVACYTTLIEQPGRALDWEFLYLMQAHRSAGQATEAVAIAERSYEQGNFRMEIAALAAQICYHQANYWQALAHCYVVIIGWVGYHPHARLLAAKCYHQLGWTTAAKRLLRQVIELFDSENRYEELAGDPDLAPLVDEPLEQYHRERYALYTSNSLPEHADWAARSAMGDAYNNVRFGRPYRSEKLWGAARALESSLNYWTQVALGRHLLNAARYETAELREAAHHGALRAFRTAERLAPHYAPDAAFGLYRMQHILALAAEAQQTRTTFASHFGPLFDFPWFVSALERAEMHQV